MNNHSKQLRNTNRTEGESQSQGFVCIKLDNGSPAYTIHKLRKRRTKNNGNV